MRRLFAVIGILGALFMFAAIAAGFVAIWLTGDVQWRGSESLS